jgi:uncharacterized membrane protein YraQ (UPF0718 family)
LTKTLDWDSIAFTMMEWISNFSAVFLGIFIEAVPYLLLGTLASGLVEVFVDQTTLTHWFPKNRWGGVLAGSILGLFFPVCECGVVPLARRLMQKGLPVSTAITFLLAAPVINPIVIASTFAAFGWSVIFWGRLGLTLVVAVITGWVFSLERRPEELLRSSLITPACHRPTDVSPVLHLSLRQRLQQVLVIAGEEFFEMGRYLILGALLAAGLQTFIPQTTLISFGQGSAFSVLVMMLLAVLLSICSTVDAFVALAFIGSFSTGSILAFLVFGPMVDIKSIMLFQRVFRPKTVVYLVALSFLLTAVATSAFALLGGV